ncbi:thiopeptide-type bacteriocin biosynthesis domain-containing protein [Chryseolinea serpens]|uniref:Thiopeptide-type bacteriocin biosynthesis domain-containing protein n=2 Tax=Chryseolinea serpens TaxID=947013 RepID=A0A1M5XTW1_9BACT|nr:thiopeptide-type bacteriocin biosynthesis domain-containing protein [Chryseolinea serpens]
MLSYGTASLVSEDNLRMHFSNPAVQEALWLASPDLYDCLKPFLAAQLTKEENLRVVLSLKKYWLRLSSRPTPFGMFASVSVGQWKEKTETLLLDGLRRFTRLDVEFMAGVIERISGLPEVSEKIRYTTNNTVYHIANAFRYIEYTVKKGKRMYQLSDVDDDRVVSMVLETARNGATREDLVQQIMKEGFSVEEAGDFLNEMIENHLLISELEIRLTGEDFFSGVCAVLQRHDIDIPVLLDIAQQLRELDGRMPSENLDRYSKLSDTIRPLSVHEQGRSFLQVDVFREASITLSKKVQASLVHLVHVLAGLFPGRSNTALTAFKKAFQQRYGFRPVKLCQVLDPETGIGYPTGQDVALGECMLLQDIDFAEGAVPTLAEITPFQEFLVAKYSQALAAGSVLQLSDADVKPFMGSYRLPSSLYAMLSVGSPNAAAIDAGHYRLLFSGAYGPSAVNVMARFCHLDPTLLQCVRQTLKKEQSYATPVYAEIVHADQARTGNISSRPVLRDFEIPILTPGGVDEAHRLPLSDLVLQCTGEELVLYSEKLGRQVIPRLSSAHNYSAEVISHYRFLSDLQHQGVLSAVRWDWGVLASAPYLPRVVLNQAVVSPARWKLTNEDKNRFAATSALADEITAWRAERKVPRHILTGEGDHRIPIDLESVDQQQVFKNILRRADVLEEFLGQEHQVFTDAKGMGYQHELVVPLLNTDRVEETRVAWPAPPASPGFGLGSEWLYYKLYCNAKVADAVLIGFVKPLAEELLRDGIIDRWFFIRYNDPKHHLRIRFHGSHDFYQVIAARFYRAIAPFLEADLVQDFCTDTYRRELERYGDDDIQHAETIFFADSICLLPLLAEVQGDETMRWVLGLRLADQLLELFDVPLAERATLMSSLQQNFADEMGGVQRLKPSLSAVYRTHRPEVAAILNNEGLSAPVVKLLTERRANMVAPVRALKFASPACRDAAVLRSRIQSFLHMTSNRWFAYNPRHYELVVYDFLCQHYKSILAKSRVKA